MDTTSNVPSPKYDFSKLKDISLVYTSMPFILEKLEKDKHLPSLHELVSDIIKTEILYAAQGKLSRAKKNVSEQENGLLGPAGQQRVRV